MTRAVQTYFESGCGRCKLFATPSCKVHRWREELLFLRNLLLQTGLREEVKWGVPCYTFNGKNVLILAAFRDYCSLNFFRGDELEDPAMLLVKAGENSQAGRQCRFTRMEDVLTRMEDILHLIENSIELEKQQIPSPVRKPPEIVVPEELRDAFRLNPELEEAFFRLTPGRQRSYMLHLQAAKQAETCRRRIQKCSASILAGKGLNER